MGHCSGWLRKVRVFLVAHTGSFGFGVQGVHESFALGLSPLSLPPILDVLAVPLTHFEGAIRGTGWLEGSQGQNTQPVNSRRWEDMVKPARSIT